MPEKDGKTNQQGNPQDKSGQTSTDGKSQTSTTAQAKTFTESEAKQMVSNALADQGRKHKESLSLYDARIKAIEDAKEAEEIDAVKGDATKLDIYQQRKKNREDADRVKADRATLESDKAIYFEDLDLAAKYRRNVIIEEVAKEYEGFDTTKLTTLCDILKIVKKEDIVAAAETLGTKKAAGVAGTTLTKPDSGDTDGSGVDFSKMSAKQKIQWGVDHPKK